MYCRMCGKEIPSDSSFCPLCGAPQETPPQAPPQTPPQAPPQPLQSTQAPKPAPKKASFLPIVAVVLVIAAGIAGFFYFNGQKAKQEKQESLTSYIDEDLKELRDLEEQLVEKIRNLIQADYDLDDFLADTKLLRAQLVTAGAHAGMSDSELATLHTSLYLDYLSTFDDAVAKMGSAHVAWRDGQSDTAIELFTESIDLMEEADDLYDQFQDELKELANERDVRYKTNDPPFEDLVDAYKDFFS